MTTSDCKPLGTINISFPDVSNITKYIYISFTPLVFVFPSIPKDFLGQRLEVIEVPTPLKVLGWSLALSCLKPSQLLLLFVFDV